MQRYQLKADPITAVQWTGQEIELPHPYRLDITRAGPHYYSSVPPGSPLWAILCGRGRDRDQLVTLGDWITFKRGLGTVVNGLSFPLIYEPTPAEADPCA